MAILRVQPQKSEVLARLKRVEGQVRGVQNMIENGTDCAQVAQQLAASRKALDRAFHHMMACVIAQEVAAAAKLDPAAKAELEGITALLAKFS